MLFRNKHVGTGINWPKKQKITSSQSASSARPITQISWKLHITSHFLHFHQDNDSQSNSAAVVIKENTDIQKGKSEINLHSENKEYANILILLIFTF